MKAIGRVIALVALASAAAALSACRPLPQQGTVAEKLYANRCSTCHRPYNPHSMTAAMWAYQFPAMEARMQKAGLPPLTNNQRAMILSYLTRNAEQ